MVLSNGFWTSVKGFMSSVPTAVWVIVAIVALVGAFWFKDDVGSWWEGKQQAKFDAKEVQYEQQIDALKKHESELIVRAEQAEAREQAKQLESDLLRQEASKHGVNITNAQKVIDAAVNKYQDDTAFNDKVKTGEISPLQLCEKQCADSAEEGYPCRVNYCEPFRGK
ncbi:hypothetical protein BH09PAT1_BH09PAT1_1410 [soil metagenome]